MRLGKEEEGKNIVMPVDDRQVHVFNQYEGLHVVADLWRWLVGGGGGGLLSMVFSQVVTLARGTGKSTAAVSANARGRFCLLSAPGLSAFFTLWRASLSR